VAWSLRTRSRRPRHIRAAETARLSPRSKARSGQPLRVVIDVERLHFFDPKTEDSIW
jgi:hypothetical protein